MPEYLILNLRDQLLEVRRNPKPALDTGFGSDYTSLNTLGPDDRFESTAIPGVTFLVSEIMP